MTRLLDLFGPEFAAIRGDDLVRAIKLSEGRTMLAEIGAPQPPIASPASNLELVAAFGADLVCLNMVDPTAPRVTGLDRAGFTRLGESIGRPVGLNLEPDVSAVPPEYRATKDNAVAAQDAGAAFVFLTANPGRGVTMSDLAAATETFRGAAPDVICIAGKMHAAGQDEVIDADLGATPPRCRCSGVADPSTRHGPRRHGNRGRGTWFARRTIERHWRSEPSAHPKKARTATPSVRLRSQLNGSAWTCITSETPGSGV